MRGPAFCCPAEPPEEAAKGWCAIATLHGRNGAAYLASGSGSAVNIAEAKGWTININVDTAEDSALGDVAKTFLKGMYTWTADIEINHDTAQAVLYASTVSNTAALPIYLYPDRATTANYYYGSCWPVSGSNGVSTGDAAGGTISVQGTGALSVN